MADKRIFQLDDEGFLDDLTDNVYMWLDKKANEGELQEPSWKFKANVFLKILNNFATKFVPNVATVEGKCYWHKGELFTCDVAYTGDWVPGNFTATSIDALFARKDVLSALQTDVGNLQGALETTNGNVTALQLQVSSLSDVSAYIVKGEATVAALNAGPSGIQAGWVYQLSDSGTLNNGNLTVVAGDTVAWDGTKWFPLVTSVENNAVTDAKLASPIKFNREVASGRYGYKLLSDTASFESQVTDTGVIYEIRWAFDLDGADVDVDGMTLYFNGGSVTNGTLHGSPKIISKTEGCLQGISFEDCETELELNWLCKVSSYTRDDTVDDSDALEAALNCGAKNLKFTNELYRITRTINIAADVNITGPSKRNIRPNNDSGVLSLCGIYSSYDGNLLKFTIPSTAGNRVKKCFGGFSVHQFSDTDTRTDAVNLVEFTTANGGTVWGLDIDIDVINHCSDVYTLPDGTVTTNAVPKASYTGISIYPAAYNGSLITYVRVSGYIHKCFVGYKFGKLAGDTTTSWITSLKVYADTWCVKGAIVKSSEMVVYGTHQPLKGNKSSGANDGYFEGPRYSYVYGFVWDLGSSTDGIAYNVKYALKHNAGASQTEHAIGFTPQKSLENTFFPRNDLLTPYETFGRLGNIFGYNVYSDDDSRQGGSTKICTVNSMKFIKKGSDPVVEYNVSDLIDNYEDVFNLNNMFPNPNNRIDPPLSSNRAGVNSRIFYVLDGEFWNDLVLKVDVTVDLTKFGRKNTFQNLVIQHMMWDAKCTLEIVASDDSVLYTGTDLFTSDKLNGVFSTAGILTKDVYAYVLQTGYLSSAAKLHFVFEFETDLGGQIFRRNLPCIGLIANMASVVDRNGGHVAGPLLCNQVAFSDGTSNMIAANPNYNIINAISSGSSYTTLFKVRYKAEDSNAITVNGTIDGLKFTFYVVLNQNTYSISSVNGSIPWYVDFRALTYQCSHTDYNGKTYYVVAIEARATQYVVINIENIVCSSSSALLTDGHEVTSSEKDLKQYRGTRAGATRYNSTDKRMELYNGTDWVNMDGTPFNA